MSAGNTGKTYVAKQIVQKLKEKGVGVKILSPTNKTIWNIGGTTIHQFLKMSKYGYICRKFLKTANITFLLFGDEKQCPSVEDKTSKITLIPQ